MRRVAPEAMAERKLRIEGEERMQSALWDLLSTTVFLKNLPTQRTWGGFFLNRSFEPKK